MIEVGLQTTGEMQCKRLLRHCLANQKKKTKCRVLISDTKINVLLSCTEINSTWIKEFEIYTAMRYQKREILFYVMNKITIKSKTRDSPKKAKHGNVSDIPNWGRWEAERWEASD